MDEEQAAEDRQRAAIIGLIGTLLSLATVVLAVYPELPEDVYYRVKLWLARREPMNTDRLIYYRQRAEAMGETADRIIPAETEGKI